MISTGRPRWPPAKLKRGNATIKHVLQTHTHRSLRIDVTAAEERLTAELESELTRVKAELEAAGQEERSLDAELERVDEEVAESEGRLQGIRAQMDSLTQEIKEANLQSLSIAPADDLKVLLEGMQFLIRNKEHWNKLVQSFPPSSDYYVIPFVPLFCSCFFLLLFLRFSA